MAQRLFTFLSLAVLIFVCAKAPAGEISGPLVVSDAWPQATDFVNWTNDVIRIEGKESASERDQALTIYQWVRLFGMSGLEPWEGRYGAEANQFDRHKTFFVWGSGDCGYLSAMHEAAWCSYKNSNSAARSIRYLHAGHVMVEYYWGTKWHAFDLLNSIYFIASDSPTADVLSFAEIAPEDALLRANETYANRARPCFERVRSWDTEPSERKDLVDITGFFDLQSDWIADGSDPYKVYARADFTVGQTMWDMSWRMPRGALIERRWEPTQTPYQPVNTPEYIGPQGRHYRHATEWYHSSSNWNAAEDIFNYPKCAPYITLCTDAGDTYFTNQHTLYNSAWSRFNWEADLWEGTYTDAAPAASPLVTANTTPYLRPSTTGVEQSIAFNFRIPFLINDGQVMAVMACADGDTARLDLATCDRDGVWSAFEEIASGAGVHQVNIGRSRFNSTEVSATGTYEVRLKFACRAATSPVTLNSNDTTELTVPATVTITASTTSTTFDLTVVNDGSVDGNIPVTVTASAGGYNNGTDVITIYDINYIADLAVTPCPLRPGKVTPPCLTPAGLRSPLPLVRPQPSTWP
ncbi:MAG: hypothetical protein ABIF71_02805 [Planctomycetota bacterium]